MANHASPSLGGLLSVALSLPFGVLGPLQAKPFLGRWVLPTTVPCGARTFLSIDPLRIDERPSRPLQFSRSYQYTVAIGRMEGQKDGRMEGWKDGRVEEWRVGEWYDGGLLVLWAGNQPSILPFLHSLTCGNRR